MIPAASFRARARSPRFRVFSFLSLALSLTPSAWPGPKSGSPKPPPAIVDPGSQRLDLPFLHTGVHLSTGKRAYWRYEMVDFQVDAAGGVLNPSSDPVLEIRIFRNGRPSLGLPGKDACLLRWDPNLQAWHGRWPIPWNPELGEYQARLARPAALSEGSEHSYFAGPGLTRTVRVLEGRWLADCGFTLKGRRPSMLPPGFSVITLEPGSSGYRFPGPEGGPRKSQNAFAWARFMGADAFWQCALQTDVQRGTKPADLPWGQHDLAMMQQYASEAASQGVAFGAYMLTFLVGGDYKRTDYEFTLSYDRRSGSLQPIRFISMADSKRQREITAALKMLAATPGVSYIGLDYVRANTGGLEFTDEFLNDFDLEVPEDLRRAGVQERRLWLGRHLAYDQDKRLHDLWDWWRAHRVALVLKGMLEEAKVTQPVWVFSLGWKQGHQHGQDPRMLIDAGISFNSPMFYEADQDQYPVMLSDWRHYLGGTGGVLVFGQCVDSKLLHPRPGFNGPEEHLQRQMEVLSELSPVTDRIAFFWHDLNRAVAGGRGGEGMREWALAGAASFSRLREAAGALPLSLSVTSEGVVPSLSGTVKVRNISSARLDKVRVEDVWTPGLGEMTPRSWWVRDLEPGESRDLTFTVAITDRYVRPRFRAAATPERMLAFKASAWHDPAWPRSDIMFSYWKDGRSPAGGAPVGPDAAAAPCGPAKAPAAAGSRSPTPDPDRDPGADAAAEPAKDADTGKDSAQ